MYLKKELYALIQSDESIFDFIQESSLDGLWYWDLENPENEWMNAKFWTVLGYNPDEMPHQSAAWQGIINHDDLELASDNFTRHCENPNHPYDQIVRYTHKNGSTVWIRCRGLAIRDKNGKPVRMLGAHQDVTELKSREEELYKANTKAIESEEKYRAFYDNAPLSYQSLDENGCFIDINPMWLKTLGYERDEVIGKWYGDFLHPDYVEHFRINFPAFKKRGYVSDVQFKLKKKDATYIHVSFEGCVGYTPDGKFKQTYCVFKDITEQKALENALIKAKEKAEESEEKYRLLYQSMDQGLALHEIITDENGKPVDYLFLDINDSYTRILGVTREMAIGKRISEVMPKVEQNWIEIYGKVALTGESSYYENYFETTGKYYSTYSYCPRNNQFAILVNDITDSKRAEEALASLNLKNKLILHSVAEGILGLDIQGNHTFVNPAAARMLGYESEELIGHSGHSCWHHSLPDGSPYPQEDCPILSVALNGNEHREFDAMFWRKDGTGFPVEYISTPILERGQVTGVVVTFFDITERKKYEFELTKAKEHAEESDRLKSAFLANMSHEIRTPMNGILGFAELLKEPDLSIEEQQEYLKIIEKSGARLLGIINDIVDISKIEANLMNVDIKDCHVNDQTEFIYNFFKPEVEEKGMQLAFKNTLPSKEATIRTDSEKVYSILTNLVKNAIKYSKGGVIEFGYIKKDETLEFYVKDTGIGIAKDRQSAIFDRFIQAEITDKIARRGTGLGLSISKAYVEMLGGKIWVESQEGKGSTFYFTLPYPGKSLPV